MHILPGNPRKTPQRPAQAIRENARPPRKRGPASLPGPVSPDFCRGSGWTIGMVSAAASARAGKGMRASVRSSRLAVLHASRGSVAVTSLGGRLHLSGRDRKSEAASDTVAPLDPLRPSASLARHFRLADLPAVWSFAPGSGHLRTLRREPGFRPLSVSPVRFGPCLRTVLSIRSGLHLRNVRHSHFRQHLRAVFHARLQPHLRAALGFHVAHCLRRIRRFPVDPGSGVPRSLGSAWATRRSRNFRGFASPNRSQMRFPEGTCTRFRPG